MVVYNNEFTLGRVCVGFKKSLKIRYLFNINPIHLILFVGNI